MSDAKTKIGVIGTGNISGVYLEAGKRFANIEVAACADIDMERARAKAEHYGIPRALTVEELLADPEIEIVVNLTIPKVHAQVDLAIIEAGKHPYSEKPLGVNREQGRHVLEEAQKQGRRVGCAPDTFLGGGLQTCRKLIDEGLIGEPVAASAFMMIHGHESWHPDPDFYYQPGGGPLFDMGPYYLTALISLIGPVRRVSGSTRVTFPERVITSQPRHGTVIKVNTPTHIAGVLDFANGAICTISTSFDVWPSHLPMLEIYGTKGSMSLPDPNGFGGPIQVWTTETRKWEEIPLAYEHNNRGIGVADMANAIKSGRPHRASGELAYHVLDIMEGLHDASRESREIELGSTCPRPAALPEGLAEGAIDA